MNCERCKNKKATLFYADEGGVRHALCPTCASAKDKLGKINEIKETEENPIPKYLLFSASGLNILPVFPDISEIPQLSCDGCGMTSESFLHSGDTGCPKCFLVFEKLINQVYPRSTESSSSLSMGRMPKNLSERLNKEKMIADLKKALKSAVENEDFEAAVILRDKIHTLENSHRKTKAKQEKGE